MSNVNHSPVALRPYRPEEFERACAIRELQSDASVERFRVRFAHSGEWFDHYLHLAITLEDALIGDAQFRFCDRTMPEGTVELGLELAAGLRGRGYGTLALRAATRHAFDLGHHRVSASTDESNLAMRRAFEKAGWHFEGVLRNLFIEDGVPHHYRACACTIFDEQHR